MPNDQYAAVINLSALLAAHPDLDGKLYIILSNDGQVGLQVSRSDDTTTRDETFDRLTSIINLWADPAVVLQLSPGRGAWRFARGMYGVTRVDISAHYNDDEAEALHVADEANRAALVTT